MLLVTKSLNSLGRDGVFASFYLGAYGISELLKLTLFSSEFRKFGKIPSVFRNAEIVSVSEIHEYLLRNFGIILSGFFSWQISRLYAPY